VLVRTRPVLRDEAVPPALEHRRDGLATVITDESNSVAGAVKAVFSGSDHRFCSWHVEQDNNP
jgi:hypothetical protein